MGNNDIVIPSLLLVLQIIMKLVVGRKIEGKNYLDLIYELPIDIIFLSLAFFLVYILSFDFVNSTFVKPLLVLFIVALINGTISWVCKHIADKTTTIRRIIYLILLVAFNLSLSFSCLYYSSHQLLQKKDNVNTEQSIKY
ncbi:MAG: hypothetical protein KAI79_02590 [Bacteroidales bacterium]|nr:hypothetical protein [Bacteroidales bacterium]